MLTISSWTQKKKINNVQYTCVQSSDAKINQYVQYTCVQSSDAKINQYVQYTCVQSSDAKIKSIRTVHLRAVIWRKNKSIRYICFQYLYVYAYKNFKTLWKYFKKKHFKKIQKYFKNISKKKTTSIFSKHLKKILNNILTYNNKILY